MTPSPKSTNKRPTPANFLEALRDLREIPGDFKQEAKIQITKMFTQDAPEILGLKSSGTLAPNESVSLNQLDSAKREGFDSASKQFEMRLSQMRQEDEARTRKQTEVITQQIKTIQEEVKTLAKSACEFSHEIEVATFQAVRNPGVYHQSFFSHLRTIIVTMRKRVTDSRHWLAEFNGRARKKSHYWGQVQKSGTKYMLSSERYMVTSTG